jgi:YidC/Oxa1 family membrane protein insertase
MMKMQKGMAALKPKLEALQQQFKNDKQKLNEETMKLYREEGINPAGQMLGCLPMFLQMPVWVALWTTLNTNIDMRHEPFFGWIRDLSAPDALIPFSSTYHIPLLGSMMGPIHAFNLLPIIMTITMYAQQKIMQKMTQPAVPQTPKYDEQGRVIPDPMVQQQKIMNFMMIFFGFIFYNFPSGLNLYILTSNMLGMAEQIYIKKQLKRRDERGDFDLKPAGPQTPRKPSFFQRMQERAEEMRKLQAERPQSMEPKKRKKSRF